MSRLSNPSGSTAGAGLFGMSIEMDVRGVMSNIF